MIMTRELAKQLEELINDQVEGAEAYLTSGGDPDQNTIEVAFDETNQLFRIVIQQEGE